MDSKYYASLVVQSAHEYAQGKYTLNLTTGTHSKSLDQIITLLEAAIIKLKQQQQALQCPLCKGLMILKHGKNGQFYGCNNWKENRCPATMKFDGTWSTLTKKLLQNKHKQRGSNQQHNSFELIECLELE